VVRDGGGGVWRKKRGSKRRKREKRQVGMSKQERRTPLIYPALNILSSPFLSFRVISSHSPVCLFCVCDCIFLVCFFSHFLLLYDLLLFFSVHLRCYGLHGAVVINTVASPGFLPLFKNSNFRSFGGS